MSEQQNTTERIRVVILDPNDISRRALTMLLQRDGGLHVTGNGRAPEEIDPIAARGAQVVVLPAPRDPHAAIASVRRASPEARLLLMVQAHEGEITFHAIESGAEGLLPLSSGLAAVRSAIHGLVETGSSVDPDLAVSALRWATRRPQRRVPPQKTTRLTTRETEILEHLARGGTAAVIAALLGLSRRTVEAHLANAYRKLGVHNRLEALTRIRTLTPQAAEA